jgi:hypothetical protein
MKVTTTYLQMLARPERVVPPPRDGLAVVHARKPTVAYYCFLYDAVGRDYDWTSRKKLSDAELAALLNDPSPEPPAPRPTCRAYRPRWSTRRSPAAWRQTRPSRRWNRPGRGVRVGVVVATGEGRTVHSPLQGVEAYQADDGSVVIFAVSQEE